MLNEHEQLAAVRSALRLLDLGHIERAHLHLLDAIKQTPTDSPCYAALVGAANWLNPLAQPGKAMQKLAEALLILPKPFLVH